MRRHTALLALAALTAACPPSPRPAAHTGPPRAEAASWLDTLDARYAAFDRGLTLAAWQRGAGETPPDTARLEADREAFLGDQAVEARLRELAEHPDGLVRTRAGAWLRFIHLERAQIDPEVRRLTGEVEAVAGAGTGEQSGAALTATLASGADPEARRRALAEFERRTQAMLPLLQSRARRLDELARRAGARDYLAFVHGPNVLPRLEESCHVQAGATAAAFQDLLERARAQAQRPPGLADYLAVATGWTGETSGALPASGHGRLADAAFAEAGFDPQALGITIRTTHGPVGGAAYGVSIPDDVRFEGNFPAGFAGARDYFRALGQAVHMKHIRARYLPDRMLPRDRALADGVGEIFAQPLFDRAWLRAQLPGQTDEDVRRLLVSARALEAVLVRLDCLHARLEVELLAGRDAGARYVEVYRDTFGEPPPGGPTLFLLTHLGRPLSALDAVFARTVVAEFTRRLAGRPPRSRAASEYLVETLLAPGNALTFDGWFASRE